MRKVLIGGIRSVAVKAALINALNNSGHDAREISESDIVLTPQEHPPSPREFSVINKRQKQKGKGRHKDKWWER